MAVLTLDLNALKQFLPRESNRAVTIWVAYSGGLDSEALLHLVASELESIESLYKGIRLSAIHVHHGVSEHADSWVEHCKTSCAALGIPLIVEKVVIEGVASFENAAREARYEVFRKHLQMNDILLQAHHANDQAETVLFRLERGTGLKGLGGIPSSRPLADAIIYRPLLNCSRSHIEQYAYSCNLKWIEDESNQDQAYRRNFLRHSVISPWQNNNPDISIRLAANASRIQKEWQVVSRLVGQALNSMCTDDGSLDLNLLPEDEQSYWISAYLNKKNISFTSPQTQALMGMLFSNVGKQPEYVGAYFRLARRAHRLYVLPLDRAPLLGELTPNEWFNCAFGRIKVTCALERGESPLELRERPKGQVLELKNGLHRPLKKWLHDQKIPTWWRDHLPYIYQEGTLVAIGDLWCHPDWNGALIWEKGTDLIFCSD
ncbi:tRNA lysidine(34) synthetase TilS [Marinomonas mediterranea]|uniref:tRNA lysidine(34) synthetase TilS n=1 Tax=Marinomonas mediterranea TaxID=119864 RepID=UPI00234AD58B|nr:tRNA lysidine(34) synthetase TilS [Marinomonas mediterranea]WCN12544.1 tRNA lysidine(34) synthetase TilS [Marinomonas mediterranea]